MNTDAEIIATAKVEAGLASALVGVATGCSSDESRRVLTGVLLEITDSAVALTGTDSSDCTTTSFQRRHRAARRRSSPRPASRSR
jgi:hypothetical protein